MPEAPGRTVQFFFGVGSRYSYLASTQVSKLAADEEARANVAHAKETRCILVEDRSFLRRA